MNGWITALAERVAQIEQVQWLPQEIVVTRQWEQLALLVQHMAMHCPHFAERLCQAKIDSVKASTPEGFAKIPLLTRRSLQTAGDSVYCEKVPPHHGNIFTAQTSGSTGEPISVRKTGLNNIDWMASNLQDHFWHKRDFTKRQCSVRATIDKYVEFPSWGPPVSLFFETGPSLGLSISSGIEQLADWIETFKPDYLLIYPSVLNALVDHFIKNEKMVPQLKQVRSMGEVAGSR